MIDGFTSAIAGAVKDNAAAAKLIDLMRFHGYSSLENINILFAIIIRVVLVKLF